MDCLGNIKSNKEKNRDRPKRTYRSPECSERSWYDICIKEEEYEREHVQDLHDIPNKTSDTIHMDGIGTWMWDEEIYMMNHSKGERTKDFLEEDDEWSLDSGATTHLSRTMDCMQNLRTLRNGEHVRVGNNTNALKATTIGDVTIKQQGSEKTIKLTDLMVEPSFMKNLMSIGRLTEKGSKVLSKKTETILTNHKGKKMTFKKGPDGMS